MSADQQEQDGPRFRSSPTGPWVAPPRTMPGPLPPRPRRVSNRHPATFRWRGVASIIFFAVLVASVGVRAYRDLSRPEAWSFWKDQYVSPSLSSARIPNVDIDHSGRLRTALAISGRIGPAAANWLRDRLDEANLKPGDVILLSSPGGNLDQGVIMGEIIHAHALATAVGAVDSTGRIGPAYCASSCVLAFAGGTPRYGVDGSALGVHRFTTSAPGRDPVADTQRVTGAILGYMTKMGVSSQVVEAMSETRDIRWLAPKEALAMNLTTTPVAKP